MSRVSAACLDCGVSILERHHLAERCLPCSTKRERDLTKTRTHGPRPRALSDAEKSEEYKALQAKAMAAISARVSMGAMPRAYGLVCADCGGKAHVYDHRDYTKPLSVDPVCRSCNGVRGPADPSSWLALRPEWFKPSKGEKQ